MLEWTPFTFRTDAGDSTRAERAALRVPEVHDRPGGAALELTVVRLPARAKHPSAPIVYLAGGPGGVATLAARGPRFAVLDALREVGDVVLVDQRGTRGAAPDLTCPRGLDAPLDRPGTREALLSAWMEWSRACARHWQGRGVDLAAYHTDASADDLEVLRAALGAERVNLLAISYGTQLAQAFMRRHPRSVARAVLAGPEPLGGILKPVELTRAHLARLDSAVRADTAASRRVPDLVALVDSVVRRLESRPARVPVTDPLTRRPATLAIGPFDVQFATAFALGDRRLMLQLPLLFRDMAEGDFSRVAPLVLRLRRYNTTAMTPVVDCATAWEAADRERLGREAAAFVLADAASFPFPDVCAAWPHLELGSAFRAPVRSDVPVLFVAGTMDGRTPPSNVDVIAPGFSRHARLVVEGGAHDDDLFLASPRIAAAMADHLRGGPLRSEAVRLDPWRFAVPRR
ncbi:MAG TPA: alpha/beta fold hydrolase [Longimicrobiaceae bacterium]|nr:alpha/beta fold hydrolase [Longimicrobiaceae bacterium]